MSRVRTCVVTSLQWIPSPCLNAKPKLTSTVLCFTRLLCFTSTAVCFVCFTSSEHQKNSLKRHALPKDCASHQLPFVLFAFDINCSVPQDCRASHQLPFVCLFKFGWNKAHAKNANKVVPCRFENNMQKRANIPKPTVTNLENISSIPVPLLNCALSGDRTCQKKLLFRLFCMNSYGSSCLGSLSEKSCCSARSSHGCQDSLSKFLGIGSCSDPIDIHYASMLFTCARSKTFGQNIAKTWKRASKNEAFSNRQTVVSLASGLAKKHFRFKF